MTDGYIVRESVLSAEQIEQVKEALSRMVRKYGPDRSLADLVPGTTGSIGGGAMVRKHNSRLFIQFEAKEEPQVDDPEALELQVRKVMYFADEEPVFRDMLSQEGPIVRIAEELLEDNALLFQDMALIKPPRIGATKPWHQDNAYFSVSPLDAVCGVWIAVDEATVQNGCMHMLRGQHHKGPMKHEHKRDCEINVRKLDLSTLVPVPLKPGSALFFSGLIPHETPPNRSAHRRRALQFHFRASQSTVLPGPEYDNLFKDKEGQPASCEFIRRQGV
ncbi:MAG: phytanoyl-CoA dioxygenase family protein [Puniceicoccaceae bacterium]